MSTEYTKKIADDGTITEIYLKDGQLHRDDGPALSERRPNGATVEKYYREGKLYRPDLPTPVVVEYNPVYDSTHESFARDGKIYEHHTSYGPNSPMRRAFKGPSSP